MMRTIGVRRWGEGCCCWCCSLMLFMVKVNLMGEDILCRDDTCTKTMMTQFLSRLRVSFTWLYCLVNIVSRLENYG